MTLREYLFSKRMTATAFAAKIGLSYITIKKWMNNRSVPTPANRTKVQRATNGVVTHADWSKNQK